MHWKIILRGWRKIIHAKAIAEALLKKDFIGKIMPVETNIVIFEVSGVL